MIGLRKILFILLSISFLAACKSKKKIDAAQKLKDNKYDFSDWKRTYYKGLYIYLPSYFEKDFQGYYLSKTDGLSLSCPDISLFASVERYDQAEAEDSQFKFDEKMSLMEAVHSEFVYKRLNSVKQSKLSISNDMPSKSNLDGYFHFIEGKSSFYAEPILYCVATVEKMINGEKKYFVVQLICPKDLAAYLSDDFRKTLKKLR